VSLEDIAMSDADFNETLLQYGGRLTPTKHGVSCATLMDKYRVHVYTLIRSYLNDHPRLPPIHFDYVDNSSLNAWAVKDVKRHYFIGMTFGTFVILRLLFMRMLADAGALPEIGDPSRESSNLPPLDDLCVNAHLVELCEPKDPDRLKFAVIAFEAAFSFLIRHEVTHILHGHLEHPLLKASGSILTELDSYVTSVSSSWTRQLMEYSADKHVALTTASHFVSRIEGPLENPTIGSLSAHDAILQHFVGVCSMFRLFGDRTIAGQELGTMHYPPVRFRQYEFMSTFCNHVKTYENDFLTEEACRALADTFKMVESAFPEFTKGAFSIEGIRDVASPVGLAYRNKLAEGWRNELRSELADVHFATVLPE
jgi:hypothetical protein